MSFRITEEYCRLALELDAAGYRWEPRAGDWILDRDDGSIGMLTVEIKRPNEVRRLNVHLPTYVQCEALLNDAAVRIDKTPTEVVFSRGGTRLITFGRKQFDADHGTCLLRALVVAQHTSRERE